MPVSLSYIDLKNACKEPGCPICTTVKKAVRKYLYNLLHESVLDVSLREKLHLAWGFCNLHAWQLQEIEQEYWHDGLGTATLYETTIDAAISELENYRKERQRNLSPKRTRFPWQKDRNDPKYGLDKIFVSQAECPVCTFFHTCEDIYVTELVGNLGDFDFREIYLNSSGMCFPHFLYSLRIAQNTETADYLLDIQIAKLKGIANDLEEYLRQHDYRYSSEFRGKGEMAWIEAIEGIVGKNGTNLRLGQRVQN